jgi:hypothetical protein
MNVQNLARGSTFPQPNGSVRVQSGSLIHVVDGLPLHFVNELEHGRNLGEYFVLLGAQCCKEWNLGGVLSKQGSG